ncbi:MAG: hypothetical protein ACRCT1_02600 [Microcoleaceae cyanobacterium]
MRKDFPKPDIKLLISQFCRRSLTWCGDFITAAIAFSFEDFMGESMGSGGWGV